MKALFLALPLFVAGCDDVLEVCHSCLTGDPAQLVAADQLSKISLVYSGKRLPASAINIYYHERCGIDCQQWVRFDAPIADARAFAQSLLVRPLLTTPASGQSGEQPTLAGGEMARMPWWPMQFPSETERGENTINDGGHKTGKGQPLSIILQPDGPNATVWIAAYST
jgi:hypothetical protein